MPTFGSLFAGIGGIDLGLERAGWTGRWQVEYDPFCTRVLEKHWPDVTRYGDITTVDWSGVERVDLLAGGFPCQPVSGAGKRQAQADSRWLWPEFVRAIRALRPPLVLVENVTNLLAINGGSAFGEVVGGLAALGYDTEWDCIPASAVGALHERDRVWIVAYPDRYGRNAEGGREEGPEGSALSAALALGEHGRDRVGDAVSRTGSEVAYANSLHVERAELKPGLDGGSRSGRGGTVADSHLTGPQGHGRLDREWFGPGQWTAGTGRRAVNDQWLTEPDVGRVAARLPAGLDGAGGLDAHPACITKARTTGVPRTDRLRVLREHLESPAASSEPSRCALCGHPLSALPCRGTCPPWYLGARTEADEHLRCLREGVYSIGSREAGEALLARLPRGEGSTGGEQAMARRVDRLRSLGNAVVPQVVEVIGRQLLASMEAVA